MLEPRGLYMLGSMALAIAGIVLVSTGLCHFIANRKGLNAQLWILLGAVFGPLALIAVLLVWPRNISEDK